MKKIIITLNILLFVILGLFTNKIMYSINEISKVTNPVKITTLVVKKHNRDRANEALKFLNVSYEKRKKLSHAINLASRATGFDQEMIVALMKTESDFKSTAISPKGYKGLMQTPNASFDYPEVDILYGAKILEEKYSIAKGDILLALSLYKGGNNPEAKKYAKQTLSLYQEIKKNMEDNYDYY